MKTIRITKQFTFETGHALYGYDGKCRNVHGHSYKLSVTVIGHPITDPGHVKYGMVIDFSEKIKARLPKNINLYSLKLQETETSYAEWFANDNT
ncbi:MAG: 6-carboxytetrahydropterin synthase [Flavobacteriaceae bacterium]|nr:6-carboxytetrahydropterin synthase [Flavobacteriaceae bacterium]